MTRQTLIGLAIIAAFAVVVFYPFKPQAPTASELSVAKRVCDRVNAITGTTALESDPMVASDCVEPDRICERRWGSHAVWGGLSDSDDVPICVCDDGYQWATDGSGRCVKQ